jgi:hypothetical protein
VSANKALVLAAPARGNFSIIARHKCWVVVLALSCFTRRGSGGTTQALAIFLVIVTKAAPAHVLSLMNPNFQSRSMDASISLLSLCFHIAFTFQKNVLLRMTGIALDKILLSCNVSFRHNCGISMPVNRRNSHVVG